MTGLQVSLLHAVRSARSTQDGESSETRFNRRTALSWGCQKTEGSCRRGWVALGQHQTPEITSVPLGEPVCRHAVYPAMTAFHDSFKSPRLELSGEPEKVLWHSSVRKRKVSPPRIYAIGLACASKSKSFEGNTGSSQIECANQQKEHFTEVVGILIEDIIKL